MIMWVYATFGMTAILVVGAVLLAVMYSRIKAFVLPYLKCYNRPDKTLMLIFERKGTVRASPGDYVSEMYEDTGTKTPLAFFKADIGGFKLGNVDVEVFYDGADVATSPELLIVVEELKRRGYRNIEEVMRAVRSGTFGGDDIVVRDGVVSMPRSVLRCAAVGRRGGGEVGCGGGGVGGDAADGGVDGRGRVAIGRGQRLQRRGGEQKGRTADVRYR